MLPDRLRRVIELLARLPGVGEKTAQRFALYLATETSGTANELGVELAELVQHVRPCERCGNLAEVRDGHAVCTICSDRRRDPQLICIVHRVQDLLAIERSGAMRGRYFVLARLLSPLDGIGPDALPLAEVAKHKKAAANLVDKVGFDN
jgi:recombination protein RecR